MFRLKFKKFEIEFNIFKNQCDLLKIAAAVDLTECLGCIKICSKGLNTV